MSDLPSKVKIVEVGPRDGLQNERDIISTENKVEFIKRLSASGLTDIEVSSFVSPKWIPQLADAKEVVSSIEMKDSYSCLVPNMKGFERALESGVKRIAIFTAASETFNKENINMSIDESIEGYSKVISLAKENNISVRAYLSTCFVCPYEDAIAPERTVEVTKKLIDLGVNELSIGDTIGKATPKDVKTLIPLLVNVFPIEKIALHFHDTYNNALSNVKAGLEMGISIYDSSAGGLGGCPYAKGASGNLATEDLLNMLGEMSIATGVDINKVYEASRYIQQYIKKDLPSKQFQKMKMTS